MPSNTVPAMRTSFSRSTPSSNGSSSSTQKSARLPALIEPTSCSTRKAQAASIVTPRNACISVSRSSGDTTRPLPVVRVAAHQASSSGSVGAIMKSLWNDTFSPARTSEPQRVICAARSGPSPKRA